VASDASDSAAFQLAAGAGAGRTWTETIRNEDQIQSRMRQTSVT